MNPFHISLPAKNRSLGSQNVCATRQRNTITLPLVTNVLTTNPQFLARKGDMRWVL